MRERLRDMVRDVFVTDTVRVAEPAWPQLHVVPIAPLLAGALKWFLADDAGGEPDPVREESPVATAWRESAAETRR